MQIAWCTPSAYLLSSDRGAAAAARRSTPTSLALLFSSKEAADKILLYHLECSIYFFGCCVMKKETSFPLVWFITFGHTEERKGKERKEKNLITIYTARWLGALCAGSDRTILFIFFPSFARYSFQFFRPVHLLLGYSHLSSYFLFCYLSVLIESNPSASTLSRDVLIVPSFNASTQQNWVIFFIEWTTMTTTTMKLIQFTSSALFKKRLQLHRQSSSSSSLLVVLLIDAFNNKRQLIIQLKCSMCFFLNGVGGGGGGRRVGRGRLFFFIFFIII